MGRRGRFKRTHLVQASCLGLLAGLWLAHFGYGSNWQVSFATGLAWIISLRSSRLAILTTIFFALSLGLWRGTIVRVNLEPIKVLINQPIDVNGIVVDDPVPTNHYQTQFHLSHLRLADRPVSGRLLISGFANNKLHRGDQVLAVGKLRSTLGSSTAQIGFAKISLLVRDDSNIEKLRRRFVAAVNSTIPQPEVSLGIGLLVGAHNSLPVDLKQLLVAAGLTHIVAVSGYNLTILVRFSRRLLAKTSKYVTTAVSVALILLFMAITGMSASIFRAAVVSLLSLGVWYYGRPIKPMVILLLSAALTAMISPVYLWQDVGWYLSFLAFFGIMVLAPAIETKLFPHHRPSAMMKLLMETTAAVLLTWPFIAVVFGRVSMIAPLANLLVLPLIPLAMLLTFLAGMAGMLMPLLFGWVAWPAYWCLHLIIALIGLFGRFDLAATSFRLSPVQTVALYLAMGACVVVLRAKATRRIVKM